MNADLVLSSAGQEAIPSAEQSIPSAHQSNRVEGMLRHVGDWIARHQRLIRGVQWAIVVVYLMLLLVPVFLPLPDRTAQLTDNFTLFAQFVFWSIWWPFVLASMLLFGRAWCGLLCPEGTLSEFASRHGRGRPVPRWVSWGGWPFVAFAILTIYGQMVSVYQYPAAALAVLGGSTVMAMIVGYRYGRNKRVWCRYLCPVKGVFGLLAKLAPMHFRTDRAAWLSFKRGDDSAVHPVNCAPLVPIGNMRDANTCHMCARCSGLRDAVALAPRMPNDAIVEGTSDEPKMVESLLIVFGLLGIAVGAFHWTSSPWFITIKQAAAEWLVDHGILWPLEWTAPWWIFTNYPDQNDVLTLLDGAMLLGYILGTALILGGAISALLALATRCLGPWTWRRFHHLAQTLIPLAGSGVFLGLSALTVTTLRTDAGIHLPYVDAGRAAFLAAASLWSIWLGWRVAGRFASGLARNFATVCVALACALVVGAWSLLFWVW